MEKIDIAYKEYVRLCERHDKLLDSSFEDFRLYAFIGTLFTLIIGFINTDIFKKLELGITEFEEPTFLVSLFAFLLISLIAARDLLKQNYLIHLSYNIRKFETFIQDQMLPDEGKKKYKIFCLRKSWREKYFSLLQKSYFFFLLIFLLLIAILPITLFFLKFSFYGIVLSIIVFLTLIIYILIIKYLYRKSLEYEIPDIVG